jgi:hypothetical protein
MKTAYLATAIMVCISLIVMAPGPAAAKEKSHRQWCKHVRDAVRAGHTLDQLTAEFDTDAAHIVKCLPRGKGKKPKATKPHKSAAADNHAGKKN